ncbi:hypothetical protein [Streptomyces hygroscopicus]|uniref:hypothetical protein n=1 Tax=Streptomyces hygroscopicus TaxID=1912 RepID=UPI000AFB8CE1|nr:hypothetical protein [Streptomyces hygroscopicus]
MVRADGIAPASRLGEAAITLSTVQYLLVPDWAEDLHRYQDRMDRLLAAPTAPTPHGRSARSALLARLGRRGENSQVTQII